MEDPAWDPLRKDFEDVTFNSYDQGPGKNLQRGKGFTNSGKQQVQLYVQGIPEELTEEGIGRLFSKGGGQVVRVKKMKSSRDSGDTFGFVTMACISDAEKVIHELHNFRIDRFTLRVKIAMSEEDKKRRKMDQEMCGTLNYEDDDGWGAGSAADSTMAGQPQQNGHAAGNDVVEAAPLSATGIGRGQMVKAVAKLQPSAAGVRDGDQSSSLGLPPGVKATSRPVGGLVEPSPPKMNAPSKTVQPTTSQSSGSPAVLSPAESKTTPKSLLQPLEDLTISINNDRSCVSALNDNDRSCVSALNEGETVPFLGRGRGRGSSNREQQQGGSSWRGGGRGGARGGGRGGYIPRGRGNPRYNKYNSHYGGYQGYHNEMMGHGHPMAGYPYPPLYTDPYGMVHAVPPTLLQPAYPMMQQPVMMANMAAQQPLPTNMAAQQPLPTPLPAAEPQKKPAPAAEKTTKAEFEPKPCSSCGKIGTLRCSRCKTPYCRAKCQTEDWPRHKPLCQAIQRENEMVESFESRFETEVGDELIAPVKHLMEKYTGDRIEITKTDSGRSARQVPADKRGKTKETGRDRNKAANTRGKCRTEDVYQTDVECSPARADSRRRRQDAPRSHSGAQNNGHASDDGGQKGDNAGHKGGACFNCNESGHRVGECPKPAFYRMQCYNCRKNGHKSKDCPEKRDNRLEDTRPGNAGVNQSEPVSTTPKVSSKQSKPLAESTPKDQVTKPSAESRKNLAVPASAELPRNREMKVVMTEAVDPETIWVQCVTQESLNGLNDVMTSMSQKFPDSVCDVDTVSGGDYYGALFSGDGVWYRARVEKVHPSSIVVQYVDFGNRESITRDKLRKLTADMVAVPAQATLCSLDGIRPHGGDWNIPMDKFQSIMPSNTAYEVVCSRVTVRATGEKCCHVVMKDCDGHDVAEKLLSAGLVASSKQGTSPRGAKTAAAAQGPSMKPVTKVEGVAAANRVMVADVASVFSSLKVGEDITFVVMDGMSPDNFSIQVLSQETVKFEAFNQKFNNFYNAVEETSYSPSSVGELVVSRFSGDNAWYRAEVLVRTDDATKVLFVDFGNSEDVTSNMMRRADSICGEFPLQSVRCCMWRVEKPTTDDWPVEALALLAELFTVPSTGKVMEIRPKDRVISLEISTEKGGNITEKIRAILGQKEVKVNGGMGENDLSKLVDEKGDRTEQKANVIKTQPALCKIEQSCLPLDGSKVAVLVSDISALSGFYVQVIDRESQLELQEIMSGLKEACSAGSSPYVPVVGEYVAAVFEGDWYRARVDEKVAADTFKVSFVDYGNTDEVKTDSIRKLAVEFTKLPCLAVCCQLVGSDAHLDDLHILKDMQAMVNQPADIQAVEVSGKVYKIEMFMKNGTSVNEVMGFIGAAAATEIAAQTQQQTTAIMEAGVESQQRTTAIMEAGVGSQQRLATPEVTFVPVANTKSRHLNIDSIELPTDGTMVTVAVVFIESMSSFYMQLADSSVQERLASLTAELNAYCSSCTVKCVPTVGDYVAARYTEGDSTSWYRAWVMDSNETGLQVFFIDFGNKAMVPLTDVLPLDEKFVGVPAMAVKGKLSGSCGKEGSDDEAEFGSVLNQPLQVKAVDHKGQVFIVELYLTDGSTNTTVCVNELLKLDISNGVDHVERVAPAPTSAASPKQAPTASPKGASVPSQVVNNGRMSQQASSVQPSIDVSLLPLGQKISVGTTVVDSIHSFYVQLFQVEPQQQLAAMLGQLKERYEGQRSEYVPNVGETVAAFYTDQGETLCYRCVVLEKGTDQYKVQFLDYGNSDYVRKVDVHKLDDDFFKLPQLACHCKLVRNYSESASLLQAFRSCVLNVEMVLVVKSVERGVYAVQMFDTQGRDVSEIIGLTEAPPTGAASSTLLVDQLPKAVTPRSEALPRKSLSPQSLERKAVFSQTLRRNRPDCEDFLAVIVSMVRPNLFHCQVFTEDRAALQELSILSETMAMECESLAEDKSRHYEVGELCCAKFPEDGKWYRATVLEIFPDNTVKVEYVDFGNQTEVPYQLLRPVTEDYTRLPLLAFRCSLGGVLPVQSAWSEKALHEMQRFQDTPLRATVVAMSNDVYELDLVTMDGVNVAEHLIEAGVAKVKRNEASAGQSEMEIVRRQNELLQQQVEQMAAQMAELMKKK